ncbi:MAG: hypothetical protein Q4615_14200 [Paracoccus aminovorans]|nr:hypothetical protein [Paracoccus aminovorans]
MARLPKNVQALLDRLEPEIRDAFLEAIDQVTDAAQLNSFIAALEVNDLDAAVAALRIEAPFFAPVDRAIGNAFASAATAALTDLRLKDPNSGDAFLLGFDGRHTRAEQWVRDRSSGLIVEIVEQQRGMAREMIETGLAGGQNPRQVALDIVGRMNKETGKREGGFIGLTNQQAQWAKNAEKELRNLDSAYFQRKRRDKRFDSTIKKAIESGKPIPEADLRRIVTRYRDRLKKYRGDTIGRTEALNSMRSGQHEGFAQLVDSGQVSDIQSETEAFLRQADAMAKVVAAGGDWEHALAVIEEEQKLLNAAQKAGIPITDEMKAKVHEMAEANISAEETLDRLRDSTERGQDAFRDLFGSILEGKDAAKQALIDLLAQMAKVQFAKGMLGLLGGTSWGSSLIKGVGSLSSWDGGGYTWDGSRTGGVDGKGGQIGILHPNETVIDHTKGQSAGGVIRVEIDKSVYFDTRVTQIADRSSASMGKAVSASIKPSIQRYQQNPRKNS